MIQAVPRGMRRGRDRDGTKKEKKGERWSCVPMTSPVEKGGKGWPWPSLSTTNGGDHTGPHLVRIEGRREKGHH